MADGAGYNVRDAVIEGHLRDIAKRINTGLPDGWGFTLLLFSYEKTGLKGEGDAGSLFYISSADRGDMIKAMKEFIARNEH